MSRRKKVVDNARPLRYRWAVRDNNNSNQSEQKMNNKQTGQTFTDLHIRHNGSATFMVIDKLGQCVFATDTLRKASNFLKKSIAQG